ncbi:hypothetical protein NDU88_005073 [Pleurodeles waltl]|uniref:Uncharacterized protein n=1 Tax=Pleurodeles waltl TaxID=8319 RepID=A0AAV7QHA3_PLEWA|nr:hypothetical protein NDU88_005073 [Pleurodeles waltl]
MAVQDAVLVGPHWAPAVIDLSAAQEKRRMNNEKSSREWRALEPTPTCSLIRPEVDTASARDLSAARSADWRFIKEQEM